MARGKASVVWRPILVHGDTFARLARFKEQQKTTFTEAIDRLLKEHEEKESKDDQ